MSKSKTVRKPSDRANRNQASLYLDYRARMKDAGPGEVIAKADPPECFACKRSLVYIPDVYEISRTGLCGWCQGWNRMPYDAKLFILGVQNINHKGFLEMMERLFAYRPNFRRLMEEK